jgi:predicted GH43/DUF377 family glycosyl hydrolase
LKKFILILLSFSAIFILETCSQKKTDFNIKRNGTISSRIKTQNLPLGTNLLSVKLTRSGFDPIIGNMNNLSVSNTEYNIPAAPAGKWQLYIDIKDYNGNLLFSGDKTISIIEKNLIKVYLHLYPDKEKTGTIFFFITYGNELSKNGIKSMDSSKTWIDFKGNPILVRENNPSAPFGLRAPKVIFDNGIFKMWYICVYSHGIANIWYAESPDGFNWKTIGSSPVLSQGKPGKWDDYAVIPSAVLKENGIYKMFYFGYHKNSPDSYLKFNDMWNTGVAVSKDGILWEKRPDPVFYGFGYNNFAFTDILKKGNLYYAYYGYNLGTTTSNSARIGVAVSQNGIDWEKQTILTSTFPWEGGGITYPTVIYDNGIFKMIYMTNNFTTFGYATSTDGIHFNKKNEPVFTCNNSINKLNNIENPYLRKFSETYWLYYVGEAESGETSISLTRNFNKDIE